MLPSIVVDGLRAHLAGVERIFNRDLAAGNANVSLPSALSRKYPNAGRELAWPELINICN